MTTVFISIADIDNIVVARDYHADAYNIFMTDGKKPDSKEFSYGGKKGAGISDIEFKIVKFDTAGLTGKYPSFCSLVNVNGPNHILSTDKDSLSAFHGFRNRITML